MLLGRKPFGPSLRGHTKIGSLWNQFIFLKNTYLTFQDVTFVHYLNVELDVHVVNALRDRRTQGGRWTGYWKGSGERADRARSVDLCGARRRAFPAKIAAELGIALGLVNAYLKRCVKKGLVKVHDAPARRYAYYLTPHGFAEKSRLTVQYLSDSFSFFRLAKADCARVLEAARPRGFSRVVLAGKSDLAEIAILCAVEAGVTIVAIVDPRSEDKQFIGVDCRQILCRCDGKI